MSNLMSRLDGRKMPTKTVPICLDLDLLGARDRAMADLARVKRQQNEDQRMAGGSPAIATALAAVADTEQAIREASILIRITGVDRDTYNRYMLACPPRKGKQESFDSSRFFMHVARNSGTYIDETGAEHEMTPDEWDRIDKTLTDGEHDRIAEAVLEVNRTVGGQGIDFLGVASEATRDSFGISVSPEPSGSRRAASGAGNRKKSTSTTSTTKAARSSK